VLGHLEGNLGRYYPHLRHLVIGDVKLCGLC
jgi:hypothetical protein